MELINMEELLEKFQFKIFKYCYQMVRNKETSEDITQEVFIKFYQLSNKNEYTDNYLYTIAYGKCIDYLRKKKLENLFVKNHSNQTFTIAIEDSISKDEYNYELTAALDSLSNYEKSVLLLKSVNGLSYKEISKILGKKESALRKQFQRAKSKIKMRLMNKDKGMVINNEKVSVL